MKTVIAKVKQYWKGIVVALAAVAVLGVAVFHTYPTYLATSGTLSKTECEQVAVLVSARVFSTQQPGVDLPEAVKEILDASTHLSKRVAKWILDANPELMNQDPTQLYMLLYQSCLMSEGKFDLSSQ